MSSYEFQPLTVATSCARCERKTENQITNSRVIGYYYAYPPFHLCSILSCSSLDCAPTVMMTNDLIPMIVDDLHYTLG